MKTFTKTILTASVWLAIALIGARVELGGDYQPVRSGFRYALDSTACMLY